jgi:hypothetical protein
MRLQLILFLCEFNRKRAFLPFSMPRVARIGSRLQATSRIALEGRGVGKSTISLLHCLGSTSKKRGLGLAC